MLTAQVETLPDGRHAAVIPIPEEIGDGEWLAVMWFRLAQEGKGLYTFGGNDRT